MIPPPAFATFLVFARPRAHLIHAPGRVLKCQMSQVISTKTVGQAQPKRRAIESVSPLTCDETLVVPPWEAKAQATFKAQPVATAIAAAARPFKRERDLSSK